MNVMSSEFVMPVSSARSTWLSRYITYFFPLPAPELVTLDELKHALL